MGYRNLFKDNLTLVIFTDIYYGRGNGGEFIFGTVFEVQTLIFLNTRLFKINLGHTGFRD